MIVRGPRKKRGFTVLDNDALRDARLTFRARGLLAFLLSQEPGYRVNSTDLSSVGGEGRDAIRAALSELEQYRYLVREKVRKSDGTTATESTVYEEPPAPGKPTPGNPSLVPPALLDETAGHTSAWKTDAGFSGAKREGLLEEKKEGDGAESEPRSLAEHGGEAPPMEYGPDGMPRYVEDETTKEARRARNKAGFAEALAVLNAEPLPKEESA